MEAQHQNESSNVCSFRTDRVAQHTEKWQDLFDMVTNLSIPQRVGYVA
jgi:hypothetical protein